MRGSWKLCMAAERCCGMAQEDGQRLRGIYMFCDLSHGNHIRENRGTAGALSSRSHVRSPDCLFRIIYTRESESSARDEADEISSAPKPWLSPLPVIPVVDQNYLHYPSSSTGVFSATVHLSFTKLSPTLLATFRLQKAMLIRSTSTHIMATVHDPRRSFHLSFLSTTYHERSAVNVFKTSLWPFRVTVFSHPLARIENSLLVTRLA